MEKIIFTLLILQYLSIILQSVLIGAEERSIKVATITTLIMFAPTIIYIIASIFWQDLPFLKFWYVGAFLSAFVMHLCTDWSINEYSDSNFEIGLKRTPISITLITIMGVASFTENIAIIVLIFAIVAFIYVCN